VTDSEVEGDHQQLAAGQHGRGVDRERVEEGSGATGSHAFRSSRTRAQTDMPSGPPWH
jgi:hypothetical protein